MAVIQTVCRTGTSCTPPSSLPQHTPPRSLPLCFLLAVPRQSPSCGLNAAQASRTRASLRGSHVAPAHRAPPIVPTVLHTFVSTGLAPHPRPHLPTAQTRQQRRRRPLSTAVASSQPTAPGQDPYPAASHPAHDNHEQLVTSADRVANLPWEQSIASSDDSHTSRSAGQQLLFMPFLMHQLHFMHAEFPDVVDLPFPKDLSFQSSSRRPARIESWQWTSKQHFRRIRATYIDAGVAAQVFNSVWYPDPAYDIPILGIDFLSFGKKKVLCVLDFQPLVQDEQYLRKYCEPIAYIRAKYEGLAGSMSARFYEESQFFSRQLAFAKFDNPEPIESQLFPAFKEYLSEYAALIKRAQPDHDPLAIDRILKLHGDYDQYSAERDPAVGLFSTYWGEDWAERFTHKFLFPQSVPLPKETAAQNTAVNPK